MSEKETVAEGSATMPLSTYERQLESYQFMNDRILKRMIIGHPKYRDGYPFHSPTNQLSNIDKKNVELLALQVESAYTIADMFTEEDEFNEGDWLFSDALKYNNVLDIHKAKAAQ